MILISIPWRETKNPSFPFLLFSSEHLLSPPCMASKGAYKRLRKEYMSIEKVGDLLTSNLSPIAHLLLSLAPSLSFNDFFLGSSTFYPRRSTPRVKYIRMVKSILHRLTKDQLPQHHQLNFLSTQFSSFLLSSPSSVPPLSFLSPFFLQAFSAFRPPRFTVWRRRILGTSILSSWLPIQTSLY